MTLCCNWWWRTGNRWVNTSRYTCCVCMSLDTKLLVNLSLPASCNGHLAATGLLFSWHTQLLADSDSQKSAAQIMRELANLGTQCKKNAKSTEHATYPTEHTTRLHTQAWPDCVWGSSRGTHLYVASWSICDWSSWLHESNYSRVFLIRLICWLLLFRDHLDFLSGSQEGVWALDSILIPVTNASTWNTPCFLKLHYYLVGVASDLPVASDSQLHFAAVYNETRMVRHY